MCEWVGDVIRATGSVNFVDRPSTILGVALAPVKGDRTEDAVEKLVEIGIDRIMILAPVEHSVVRWDGDRAVTSMQRIERVVRAAAMQSRRVWLPIVEGPTPLAQILTEPGVAMAEPGGTADLSSLATVVVGPEGGFSAAEVSLAQSTVDLGAAILRAGTAAVVAGALMVAHSRR
jgi:16S rRNA (uracil1498-N3)-methyltransferase